MLDVIQSLGIEYCAANPGSSFRGLHESIMNYGGNRNPELLTCLHEESSVAMAHGYAKIEGKPMMIMAHGTVGLQHASMAIYNAYCDRVPVYIVARQHSGRELSPRQRRVGAQRAGRRRHGARLHQVGRHPGIALALRRIGRARLQDLDDAALRAGGAGGRRRVAGRTHHREESAHSETSDERPAAGRHGRRQRSRADVGGGRESGDRRRTRGAVAARHRTAGGVGGAAAGSRAGSAPAHELPHGAPSLWQSRRAAVEPERARRRRAARPGSPGPVEFHAQDDALEPLRHGVAIGHASRAPRSSPFPPSSSITSRTTRTSAATWKPTWRSPATPKPRCRR